MLLPRRPLEFLLVYRGRGAQENLMMIIIIKKKSIKWEGLLRFFFFLFVFSSGFLFFLNSSAGKRNVLVYESLWVRKW